MAEAKVLDKVEDIITCSLCREILNQPKTFECLHSFCKGCIDSLELVPDPSVEITENESKSEICQGYSCPLCRRFTPITDVRSMHIVVQLLDAYHASKMPHSVTNCILCPTKDAKWYCSDCKNNNFLCDTCKSYHDTLVEHQVATVEDYKKGNYAMEKPVYCETHPTYKVELFCTECEKLTCVMCKILNHDGHKAESISGAVQSLLPKLKEDVKQIKENIQSNKEEVKRLEEDKKAIIKKFDMEIQDVEDQVSEATQVIKWVEATTRKTQGVTLLKELQEGLLNKVSKVASINTTMHASKSFPWAFDTMPSVLTKTIQLTNPGGIQPFTRIAILWNRVAAFCHPNARVFLVDFDGNQTDVLELDCKVGKPRTAVQIGEEEAILASSTGLFLIDRSGKVISTIGNGDFSDACLRRNDGGVYALEHNKGIISSFKSAQGNRSQYADIVLQNYKSERTTDGNNFLFSFTISKNVICLARNINSRIVFYDMNGNQIKSIKTANHPSVCGNDSRGNAILCNWCSNSIDKVEDKGTIKTLLQHGLSAWYAVFQDRNTLWLIEGNGTLYQYKTG